MLVLGVLTGFAVGVIATFSVATICYRGPYQR
jgi:hypothetical protein